MNTKKFKELGPAIYEPPQLSTYAGSLFAEPLEVKEEETQTEEERIVERERVEKEKEEERKMNREAGEKVGDGMSMMSSQSAIAMINVKAEKCEWLNDILYKFWRTSAQGLVSSSLGMTRDILDMVMVNLQELPLMRGVSVQLKNIQVGDHAPYLVSMSTIQTMGCDDMIIDTELKWDSNISISGILKKGPLPVPFSISDLSLDARAKVGLKIDRENIFKSLLGISLTEECSPDFKVAAVTKIPGFDQIIHVIVKAVVSMLLLWPTYMAFRLDGSYADFFEESEEALQRPFAEIALLRGDVNRGKLPLGWNMVKALHAPWVTPIGKGSDTVFYICYRRATDEEMAKEDFVPVTSIKFADQSAGRRHNLITNTLFGLSGNLTGKSNDRLYLAVDCNSYGAPIVEIAVAEQHVKPKDNCWVPVPHVNQPDNNEPFQTQKTSLYVRYGERGEGKGKFEG
uniref:SMP-LTD domain-containing protein n=1 Tax=Paramoeba aestuarina TaxID=180227 RepID=A0A7S4KI22_9EUKA|mmetsp:Transcript_19315/g.30241  ORF Transcript_19315/g.30241 Transcript_19315/m.30241 type:complete len:456 (+) Transcript_19315:1275-2642(+)